MNIVSKEDFADVILPTTSLGTTLKALRKNTLSISNRLRSINHDANFVARVASAYNYPLIANERCGTWYIPPRHLHESVYFKSTDGHMGEWKFSLRRLNLHILDIVVNNGGVIIVDSTRRGKLMPDALSKTIPTWCAVVNSALFPEHSEACRLYTPSRCVSRSEHDQILTLLPSFVAEFMDLGLDLKALRDKIIKPLQPRWVVQDSTRSEWPGVSDDLFPVVLCTASRCVPEGDVAADGYVQGAGDDNEHWSCGLTPQVFWDNCEELMATSEGELPASIARHLQQLQSERVVHADEMLKAVPDREMYTGPEGLLDNLQPKTNDVVIHCSIKGHVKTEQRLKVCYHHLKCRSGKLGSRDLRMSLDRLSDHLQQFRDACSILICCADGSDLAAGVALYVLCLLDLDRDQSMFRKDPDHMPSKLDKQYIKRQLARMFLCRDSKLSRGTLLAVHDALLSRDLRFLSTSTFSSQA